jgi:CelD/BcsL family acetyltransferase involved in cellulose biosynthesis
MSKSQTFRKNLKTAGRRLRDAGDLQYRVYDAPETTRTQLDVYRDIEGRSWKSVEGVGVSRSDDYFEFYREMAEAFGPRRGFIIRILTVGEKAIAGTFGLEFDGVYYSLQIVHDREFSRSSPGTYLEGLEMEECFGHGYREYEFLGGFLNNKSRWTSTFRYTTQLHVFRRTLFFTALHLLLFRLKPWVKELVRPYMKSWRQSSPRTASGDE